MKVKAVFEPAKEDGLTVYVPSLSGCISDGGIQRMLEMLIG